MRFLIVGGGTAALLMGLSFGLMRLGAPPFGAGLAAYAVSFVVAYTLQRNWTFRAEGRAAGRHSRTLPRYLLVQASCALVSGALSHLLVRVFGWPPALASAGMTVCVAGVSYFASSLWVFADDARA